MNIEKDCRWPHRSENNIWRNNYSTNVFSSIVIVLQLFKSLKMLLFFRQLAMAMNLSIYIKFIWKWKWMLEFVLNFEQFHIMKLKFLVVLVSSLNSKNTWKSSIYLWLYHINLSRSKHVNLNFYKISIQFRNKHF